MTKRPSYPYARIQSIESLRRSILFKGSDVELMQIASQSGRFYREFELPKRNGEMRQVTESLAPLKDVQLGIHSKILKRVAFPNYVQGGVRQRDAITNADCHAGAWVQLTEDVRDFFGSVTADQVFGIWHEYFRFSREVAEILTDLTTRNGALPQGTSTSQTLANLVFWPDEHALERRLAIRGFRYTRFVDDVTISRRANCSDRTLGWAKATVMAYFNSYGFLLPKEKSSIQRAWGRMVCTRRVNNRKPALPSEKRAEVRAAVKRLETLAALGFRNNRDYAVAFRSIRGRVANCKLVHRSEGTLLEARLGAVTPTITFSGRRRASSPVWSAKLLDALRGRGLLR